jgi:hypothetical protein
MIRLQDIMAVAPPKMVAVRPEGSAERSFSLGHLMDKVNRRSSNSTLLTTFSATHSGTIVNHRVYPGRQMKASQRFWLEPYAKPVLNNHPKRFSQPGDPQPEVVGRIRKSEYIQLVPDEQWANDWRKPGIRDQGSGFSKVQAGITKAKAIEDVLTERFLTVSVGMDTNHLFCSACGNDWGKKGGRCDHMPGQHYQLTDGPVAGAYAMFFVTGMNLYDHLARVNTPAQPYSTVLGHQFMDSQDSDLFENGEVLDGSIARLLLIDSREGPMELLLDDSSIQDPTSSWKEQEWAEAYVLDALASRSRIVDELLDEALPKVEAFRASERKIDFGQPRFAVGPRGVLPICDSRTAEAALSLVRRGFVKGADIRSLESRISECVDSLVPIHVGDSTMSDLAKEWAEIVKMADGLDIKDGQECNWAEYQGDLFDLATQEGVAELRGVQAGIIPIADAVLTSKARKQLPDDAFCGPNRSFPVHDAAHVRNALARLPQATTFDSAQKSRILACVRSRAKKFGVKVSADQLAYDKLMEMLDTKSDIDLEAKGPEGETDDQKIRRLTDQLESAKGKIKDQDATVDKLMGEQKNLQGELKKLYSTRIFNLRSELKKGDVTILDSEDKRQEYTAKLGLRTVSSLRDSIHDLEAELAPPAAGADPRTGDQTQDPTRDLGDADAGGKPPEGGDAGKTDDSKPEDRFAQMLSGSPKK